MPGDAVVIIEIADQVEPRGACDAVAASRPAREGFDDDVLVLSGDSPLLTDELLRELVEAHRAAGAAATVLTFEPDFPLPYGRIIRDGAGSIEDIVEETDATPEQLEVRELNSST